MEFLSYAPLSQRLQCLDTRALGTRAWTPKFAVDRRHWKVSCQICL